MDLSNAVHGCSGTTLRLSLQDPSIPFPAVHHWAFTVKFSGKFCLLIGNASFKITCFSKSSPHLMTGWFRCPVCVTGPSLDCNCVTIPFLLSFSRNSWCWRHPTTNSAGKSFQGGFLFLEGSGNKHKSVITTIWHSLCFVLSTALVT